jgi:hypothetical protein
VATRRKPNYPYEAGAYSSTPGVQRDASGKYTAEGTIESWRGSAEDICRCARKAADALSDDHASVAVRGTVTDWAGANRTYASLAELESGFVGLDGDEINAVRVEFLSPDLQAAIVARHRIPGIGVTVQGERELQVDASVRMLFRCLMRGYVDRWGGVWRPTAAIAMTMVLGALTVAVASDRSGAWPTWLLVVEVVVGLTLTLVVMVNSWQWTLVRTAVEFVPDGSTAEEPWTARVKRLRRERWVASLVGLAGVIAVGIFTNKLSDLIHWP